MTLLDELIAEIEREYSVARVNSSRAALYYIQRSYEEGWAVGSRDVRDVLGDDLSRHVPDPYRVEAVSRQSYSSLKGLDDAARAGTRAVFARAVLDASMDLRAINRALQDEVFGGILNARIPIIARTESNRAGNAAKVDRYQASGITHHEALTAGDGRVRDFDGGPFSRPSPSDHRVLDGQVRRIGEAFDVPRIRGGPSAESNYDRHPPFDPNCRCTLIPVLPDPSVAFGLSVVGVSKLGESNRARRLRDWHATVDAYGNAMRLDVQRVWRGAFERVVGIVNRRGFAALAVARG